VAVVGRASSGVMLKTPVDLGVVEGGDDLGQQPGQVPL
jgi:hypothetical protein